VYHILSTLIKFPPPKDLRSDSRSTFTSISFLGFIIPDKIELNFFFFFFLIVFLAFTGASFAGRAFCDLSAGTTRVDDDDNKVDVSTVLTPGRGRFLVVVVVLLVLVFAVEGSCGETEVFAATGFVRMGVLVAFVASEGRGGAFGGGAASAESMVISILYVLNKCCRMLAVKEVPTVL